MEESKYIEALNDMSIESYDEHFNELAEKKVLTKDDLKTIQRLPINVKMAAYGAAILACDKCTDEARNYARDILRRAV